MEGRRATSGPYWAYLSTLTALWLGLIDLICAITRVVTDAVQTTTNVIGARVRERGQSSGQGTDHGSQ